MTYRNRHLFFCVLALLGAATGRSATAAGPLPDRQACMALHQTSDIPPPDAPLVQGKPLGSSRLLSFPDDGLQAGRLDDLSKRQALVWVRKEQPPILLATLSPAAAGGAAAKLVLHLPKFPGDVQSQAQMTLSSIEHLYSLVLLQERTQGFDLVIGRQAHIARALPAGGVLAALLRLRECAANGLSAIAWTTVKPWEAVTITPRPFQGPQQLRVSALIKDSDGKPVAGADVSFERGEHLACMGRTDAQGVAACTLFDAHGHDNHGEGSKLTLINFSGLLSNDRILPPTTGMAR